MPILSAPTRCPYMGRPTHFLGVGDANRAGREARPVRVTPATRGRRGLTELLNGRADGRELRVRLLAEERDGGDAHHGDQRDEQGVLDEAGAPLRTTETRPQVRGALLLP